jgi:D-alanyl-D-alanine carboxypeptidase
MDNIESEEIEESESEAESNTSGNNTEESMESSEVQEDSKETVPEEEEEKPELEEPFADLDKSTILLVNKNNKLPDDYELVLKTLPDRTNKAAEEAYQPMCDMLKAARKDGMILEVCSSYRSVERQKELFEEDMHVLVRRGYSYLDAYDEVARQTMPPGYSEHSTGLAFDIVALDYQMLNEKQETTEENQWLREHCTEYGFILRYPKDKEDITGIDYESWHFRYVGVEIAEYIMDKGITLEEFLEE